MKNRRQAIVRTILTMAITGLGLALPAPASADFLDFTVNEGTVPGAIPFVFTADKITGGYTERITFDASGNFDTTAYADFGFYSRSEGSIPVPSNLSAACDTTVIDPANPCFPALPSQYALYALFASSGTATPGAGGSTIFTGATGTVSYYVDPNRDTLKAVGATGADPIGLTNSGDDYLILFANNLAEATGVLQPPTGGFFDFVFTDPTLTGPGAAYWLFPPVSFTLNPDGDFDNFAPTGTQTVTGDVSTVFQAKAVPEPMTLALFGMTLLGSGMVARRRRQQRA